MLCKYGRLGPTEAQMKRFYKKELRKAKRLRSKKRGKKLTLSSRETRLLQLVIPILHKASQSGDIEQSTHYTLYCNWAEAFGPYPVSESLD